MEMSYVIQSESIKKSYKGFHLNVENLKIPKGFATAIIGENGAGKTTLLNILAGIRLDYKGKISYFEGETDVDKIKERLGYTGPGNYFLPNWSIKQVGEIGGMLFDNFNPKCYEELCMELGIGEKDVYKKVNKLSDGNKMKLTLATVFARKTECLLMDEPASPLDPLMRDKLCEMIRDYIEKGQGKHTAVFSTHNISDMESVTDYCIIMEHGNIVEEGFIEDLKEKYILVKGEVKDIEKARSVCYSFSSSNYGFEGICLAENLDKLAGLDIDVEVPSLFQISVAVMKANTNLKMK